MLLKDILLRQKNNKKTAIKYKNENISYDQLFQEVDSKKSILKNRITELSQIKNIGIFLPNSIKYAIAYFTISFLDKVIVPIGIQAKEAEVKSTLEYCEINIIITNTKYKSILLDCLQDYSHQLYIFSLDDNTIEKIHGDLVLNNFENNLNSTDDNEVAIMLHTSGTTSNPKRVMLTHKNLISNVNSNIETLKLIKDDKVLIALPMFFGYCNTAQFLTHLYLGASIVIMPDIFIPAIFFKLVQEERITNFTGVPTMLLMLLQYKNKIKYNISSLKYICFGGGNMPVEKLKALIDTFPTVGFIQTYGQTEASPRVTALLPKDAIRKVGSIGKPIPNIILKIVNEDGLEVKENDIGEIIVKGHNIMKGYYKRPDETNKVLKNGWLHTNDLAYYDKEGYIYLVGRKKNMIISGGLNIYPEEIEEIIMCHPHVKEVCVMSKNHNLLGEVPIAKIVLKNEEYKIEKVKKDLINYCVENLAKYKVPDEIIFVTELPKTVTGKIRRHNREDDFD